MALVVGFGSVGARLVDRAAPVDETDEVDRPIIITPRLDLDFAAPMPLCLSIDSVLIKLE